jgi:hypothetical protein
MSDSGQSLFKMYHKAGKDALAHRLQHVFHPIRNEADIALHNDIVGEVLKIIKGKERTFLSGLTDLVLRKRRRKRFLEHVATLIDSIGYDKVRQKG